MQPIFVENVHRLPRGSPSGLGSFALGDDAIPQSGIDLTSKYGAGGSQSIFGNQSAAANLGVETPFYSSNAGNPTDGGAWSTPNSYSDSFNFDPTFGGQLPSGGTSAAYGQQAASGTGVADFFNSFFNALTGPKQAPQTQAQLPVAYQQKSSAMPLVLGGVALAAVVGAVVLFSSGKS